MGKKSLRLLALVLVLALVSASCITIKVWKYSKVIVDPGTKVMLTVKMKPLFAGDTFNSIPFVLVGYNDMEPGTFKKLDTDGNYGGPYNAVGDATLATLGKAECLSYGVKAGDFTANEGWKAYHTGVKVDITGKLPLMFRHKVGPAGDETAIGGATILFSGIWTDDGNGIAETGEIVCSGMVVAPIEINQ